MTFELSDGIYTMRLLILLVLVTSAAAHRNFIIRGDDVTEPGKWPWQGSIYWSVYGHFCGISLISETWGVTAAHCLEGEPVSDVLFMFGSNDLRTGGQIYIAAEFIMHERYNIPEDENDNSFTPNDIAVVRFADAVRGEHITTIPLADAGVDPVNSEECWVTGWGDTKGTGGGVYPDILQEADMIAISNEECAETWGEMLNDGMACVSDVEQGHSVCGGDSGGPLVCRVNGKFQLFGATSWGEVKCNPRYPSVYTRLPYFRDWIKEKTGI